MKRLFIQVFLPYICLLAAIICLQEHFTGVLCQDVTIDVRDANGDPVDISEEAEVYVYDHSLSIQPPIVSRTNADYTFTYTFNRNISRYQPYNDSETI